jgi:diacylglycerol kinase
MYSNTYTCISITCTYSDNAVCVISSSLVVAGTGRGRLCAMLDLGLAVMRGERERPRVHMAYWLLAALYAFAMLGNAVAAGEGMLQDVALCIPLVTAAVPLGVGVAAGAATEAAATRLSEHVVPSEEAVAASVEAWCDVFMRDFQEQHCVDRRWS